MNEKAQLKRIAAQNKVFRAAVEAQRVALDAYNKAKRVEDQAFVALIESNQRVDREKYVLVCVAIGQKPEEPAI